MKETPCPTQDQGREERGRVAPRADADAVLRCCAKSDRAPFPANTSMSRLRALYCAAAADAVESDAKSIPAAAGRSFTAPAAGGHVDEERDISHGHDPHRGDVVLEMRRPSRPCLRGRPGPTGLRTASIRAALNSSRNEPRMRGLTRHPRLPLPPRRGWPGRRRAEATPSLGRLCPP